MLLLNGAFVAIEFVNVTATSSVSLSDSAISLSVFKVLGAPPIKLVIAASTSVSYTHLTLPTTPYV